ncbi:peptidyl-prolyl cis-trans isomerase [Hymenobacter sp. J193]|uniref:peptidyl-prolyl cis-trans isomerase n=1 Tax=Hymenobacter sp. J193 TaxID=2898429 RepID=UPI0035B07D42
MAYAKAQELKGKATDLESFRAAVAADKTLQKQEAKGLDKGAQAVNTLQGARELVRWSYYNNGKKTEVGDVSDVFEIGDQYVLAVVTGAREKGVADVASIKPELTALVRNEEKAKQIMAKLQGKTGTLEQLAAAYGNGAQVNQAQNIAMGAGMIPGIGNEPVAVGKIFGLKPGQKSAPIQGDQGVLVVQLENINKEQAAVDVQAIKRQLVQQRSSRLDGAIYEAVKKDASVEDNRPRFF